MTVAEQGARAIGDERRKRPRPLGGARSENLRQLFGGQKAWDSDWPAGYTGRSSLLQQLVHLSGAESLTSPYAESQWVRACIKILGNALLQAPPRLYLGDPVEDEKAEQLAPDHPFMRLLRSPSDHQSGATFRYANLTHIKLEGETIWFLMDRNGAPVSREFSPRAEIPMPSVIVPLRGSWVQIKRTDQGAIYVYPARGKQIEFPAASVVHFREYDPDNPLDGSGDVESLLRDLAADFQAQRYSEGLLANGGQPGGWIISKKPMDRTRREQEEKKLRDSVENVNNAGAWSVVDGDVQVVPNTMRPRDMEYQAQRLWVFRSVARVLGVPLPLLGDMEHATYANMEQARRLLWTGGNGVISYLRAEEDTINSFLLPRIKDSSLSGKRIVLRHDLSVVPDLQDDNATLLEKAANVANLGVGISLADAADAVGLEAELPETARVVLVQAGKVHLEDLGMEPESEEDEPDEEQDEPEDSDDEPDEPDEPEDSDDDADKSRTVQRAVQASSRALETYEPRLARAVRGFLRRYELAQMKRLREFAEKGEEALGKAAGGSNNGSVGSNGSVEKRALPKGPQWIAMLTELDIQDLLLDPEEWFGKFTSSVSPIIRSAFTASARDLATRIGATAITAESPTVIDGLSRQVFKLTQDVSGTLAKKTRRAIVQAFAEHGEGLGMVPIQDAVRRLLPELSGNLARVYRDRDARALAIARTEIGTATSTAQNEQATEAGAIGSRWVTSGDEQVRDAHALLDGEYRNVGDEFAPRLRFPHDVTAPPEQRINCRCDQEWVFAEVAP